MSGNERERELRRERMRAIAAGERVAESRTPDLRELRNGLPEFVPYVYRGTGEDQLPLPRKPRRHR